MSTNNDSRAASKSKYFDESHSEETERLLPLVPPPATIPDLPHVKKPSPLKKFTVIFTLQWWLRFSWAVRIKTHFEYKYLARTINLPVPPNQKHKFPSNAIKNNRYNPITFLPLALFLQFKYFYNLYFLCLACTQFISVLQVGYLFTYWLPLMFVVGLALCKEAYDDIKRWKQDNHANNQMYQRLLPSGDLVPISSAGIQVGHIIVVNVNERVPADLVLLKTTDKSGASFIRTDQLDGETDWKLRLPIAKTQRMSNQEIAGLSAAVYAEEPKREIYSFVGKITYEDGSPGAVTSDFNGNTDSNIRWLMLRYKVASETRSALNRAEPCSKTGITEQEINSTTQYLFLLLAGLAFLLVACTGFTGFWYIYIFRFIILLSSIIPISMRVNLDFAKMFYAILIMMDPRIKGTIVRNSNLPEQLGRIHYLLSDKTGTLTQNDMTFKKLHMQNVCFRSEDLDELHEIITEQAAPSAGTRQRAVKHNKGINNQVLNCVKALALCHSVTPVREHEDSDEITYQAASPDEVALVKFTEKVGMTLHERDLHTIILRNSSNDFEKYEILETFPFASATKRMGIILRDGNGIITFWMKGADVVMGNIVRQEGNEWMQEETGNMAREGLRTLVFGSKVLSEEEYDDFRHRLHEAQCSIEKRDINIRAVIDSLEVNLDLLCVTGVEDKLQDGVMETLEKLRDAGIKTWMLTGDKLETATCIAISTKLFTQAHPIKSISVKTAADLLAELEDFFAHSDSYIVIDGTSLQLCLDHYRPHFFMAAQRSPGVVCCRCSPTQKAISILFPWEKLL
ncbi:aminophospholipid-transporting P-type ATPase [Pelomyxa schiedti]|nr:aminophospholipid-transporting P-type ATPase [Pelomyxa schiedti]